MAHQVFISYSSKEVDTAIKVCEFLENNGIACWMAPRNVVAGSNYASQIVSAIKACSVLVLLASENTNASGHVSNEVSLAFDNKCTIIPFKLQNFEFTDEYLYFLGRKHWIEAHLDLNEGLAVLKKTICEILQKSTARQSSNAAGVPTPIDFERPAVSQPLNKISDLSRKEIVDIITEKSKKYPYNLYEKLSTPESYSKTEEYARRLFSHTMRCYKFNDEVQCDNLVDLIIGEASASSNKSITVKGMPGSAKNMLLQLAFYKMLQNFENGKSDYLPFYISASFYEKLPYNPVDVYSQMRDILAKEFKELFDFVDSNKNIKPVLFIEAIREHNVAKIAPENVVLELWRKYGKFNRVTTVDTGLIKNKARLKRVIPVLGDGNGYTILTDSVPIDDGDTCRSVIEAICGIYDYKIDCQRVYSAMKEFKFTTADIFLVRLVIKEMRVTYDISNISLYDMYEKLALSELYGDEERLFGVAHELFEYVFDESYNVNTAGYNGAMWSLPHKHGTYLEFLIAYYFIKMIEKHEPGEDCGFFRTVLTSMSNHFVASFMNENYHLQETIENFVISNYGDFDVLQKSNGVYWLGRLSYRQLADKAVPFLFSEFEKLKKAIKTNNKMTQENCDNHFLFRAVSMGLLHQNQEKILDEYLCMIVINDAANAINRGAAIEYFGNDYQIAAHDSYCLDVDLRLGEQVIKILNGRIESALSEKGFGFVETDLVTLLTMLQARTQANKSELPYELDKYISLAQKYLQIYKTRPQNVVSGKLMAYFAGVEEDFARYSETGRLDIAPSIYNQFKNLREVKRKQWLDYGIDDPESISEHTYNTWLIAMMFLPEEYEADGYSKKEILDMLLIHDLAESALGDQQINLAEPQKELKSQNEVLKKLFLKGTYPGVANLTYYYNVWTGYYNGLNINSRVARDLNLIQTVYTFCEYCCAYPEKFDSDEIKKWLNQKTKLGTDIGYELYNRLVAGNKEFEKLLEL